MIIVYYYYNSKVEFVCGRMSCLVPKVGAVMIAW